MKAILFIVGLALAFPTTAQPPSPNDVYIRVVDVGDGLCTITVAPGPHYMVYDAGHWLGQRCISAVRDMVANEHPISLMLISHSGPDHLGDADEILTEYQVRRIVWTGSERQDTASWRAFNRSLGAEVVEDDASVLNLRTVSLRPGQQLSLGRATVTLVAGWAEWHETDLAASERQKAISIVAHLEYQGNSVLFAGDTVGRRVGDPDFACRDAEARMVDDAAIQPIRSDVLIAPNHGGDNASSTCFIEEVDPTFVIFSAGHNHEHPSHDVVQRYLTNGVQAANIFRTDRGDNEGGAEWAAGSIPGCSDGRGDDDVEIVLPATGAPAVAYRQAANGC